MWWINTVWTTPSRIKGKCKIHYLNFYTYRIYYINGCRSSQIHKFSPDKIWNLHPYLNLRWGMNLKLLNREHKYTYIYIYMERNWVIKREVKTKIKTEKPIFLGNFLGKVISRKNTIYIPTFLLHIITYLIVVCIWWHSRGRSACVYRSGSIWSPGLETFLCKTTSFDNEKLCRHWSWHSWFQEKNASTTEHFNCSVLIYWNPTLMLVDYSKTKVLLDNC